MKKPIQLLIIITVTAAIYMPALHNQFNTWDDYPYISGNKQIELTKENITKSFLYGENHGMYAPLTALSNSIIYEFAGLKSQWYILTNLLIHLINIVLLYEILLVVLKPKYLVIVTTAIFALHPMNVEVVAYAVGKRDVLYVMFYLLSMLFYLRSLIADENSKENPFKRHVYEFKREKKVSYILSIVFAVLSLLSKGQALTIVATLFLLDLFMKKKLNDKKIWLNKIPFFIFSLVIAYQVYNAPTYATGIFENHNFGTGQRTWYQGIIYASSAFVQYITNLIIPHNLSLVHPFPTKDSGQSYYIPAIYYLYFAVFVLILIFVIKNIIQNKKRIVTGAILFYTINIVLLLQVIANSYSIMNDHYVYFAGIGIFVIISIGFYNLYQKNRLISQIALTCYFGFISYCSLERIGVFKNDFNVWNDVVKKYPNEKIGNYKLGSYYDSKNDYNRALFHYTKTLETDKAYIDAAENRAIILDKQGYHKEALNDLNVAIAIDSTKARLYLNRGCVLQSLGYYESSIADFNKATVLKSSYELAFINRAVSKNAIGQYQSAIIDCDSAITLKQNCKYYFIRAVSKANIGNLQDAIEDCKKSLSLGCDEKMVNDLLNKIQ